MITVIECFRFQDKGDYENEFPNTKQCVRVNQRHFDGKML